MSARKAKDFEFKLGKLGFALFTCGVSLLLLLAFVSGVMVGKHIESYPQKIARGFPDAVKQKLIETSNDVITKAKETSVAENLKKGTDNIKLTFYETLPQEGVTEEEPPEEPKAKPAAKPVRETPRKKEPAVKTAPKKPPEPPKPKKAPAPVVTPAKPAGGSYSVQIASFRDKKRMETMRAQLRKIGYDPSIAVVNLGAKGTWYRVKLEGYGSFQAANGVSKRVEKKIRGIKCLIKKEK